VSAHRTKRDTYLGGAALLLGVCQVAFVLYDGILISAFPRAGGWAIAAWSVEICRYVLVMGGLLLAGFGFLRSGNARARMIRSGAFCIAGGYLLAATVTILYGCQYPFGNFVHLYHGFQVALVVARVTGMLAAVWVARAFSAKLPADSSEAARTRNLRLGWAAAFFTITAVLWIVIHMLNENEWHFWARGLPLRPDLALYFFGRLAGDVMWVTAGALAAAAFLLTARRGAVGNRGWRARREGMLADASALFALSAVLYAVGNVSVRWFQPFTSWREAAYSWIGWLAGVEVILPGVLAAIGFTLSRRSLGKGVKKH
jgi:hypothetical protein